MDVLSDVLRVVRLSGAVFFTAEFSCPWALESPRPELLASVVMPGAECVVLFHILTEGECLIECGSLPTVRMAAGDVIVFPHGDQHTMRSQDGTNATPIGSVFSPGSRDEPPQVCFGGGGRESRFICGYLCCDQRFNPLVGSLPTMLLVRSRDDYAGVEAIDERGNTPRRYRDGTGTWLGTTLKFTISEARAARPGQCSHAWTPHRADVRGDLREDTQQLQPITVDGSPALNDPQVGKVLRLLHADPVRNWTVEELAREVAMSRSALAERFAGLVGEAPMRYLPNWRMQLARQMLRESRTIQEVRARAAMSLRRPSTVPSSE